MNNWNTFLGDNSEPDIDISSIEIVIQIGGDITLIGTSTTPKGSSSVRLVQDGSDLYERGAGSGGGTAVTCSGCTSTGQESGFDWIPHSQGASHWCSSCSEGNCTKTGTNGLKAVLILTE